MKTVVGLFDTMEQVNKAAFDLESAGITHNDISVVVNNMSGQYVAKPDVMPDESTNHAIEHDALVGAEIGGVAGLLIGLTSLTIPGIGWAAGVGWFWMMLTGAAFGALAGGLVGGLTRLGVMPEDAASYIEGVRRGGQLVVVRVRDEMADNVAWIMSTNGAVKLDERAEQYRREGLNPTATASDAALAPSMPQPITAKVAPVTSSSAATPEVAYGEHISRSTDNEAVDGTPEPWDVPATDDRVGDKTVEKVR
jgi:uncharacterized membrane protein